MPRLFIALRPPEPIRDALTDTMERVAGARWQDDHQLHLTVRFVGEVARGQANDLADALGEIAWWPFDLRIEGVGAFERRGRSGGGVHALWARVPPTAELEGLRQKVERACEAAGLPRESRRFTPHITVARRSRASGPIGTWLATFGALGAGPWEVTEFSLYESRLGQEGAHYRAVASYPLCAA